MYRLISNRPSSWWMARYREGLPLGNGQTGALVYGGAASEKILLNHAECWRGGECTGIPDVSYKLKEAQQKILNGDMLDGSDVLSRELGKNGYRDACKMLTPVADLVIETPAHEGFYAYERALDFDTGVARVSYKDGSFTYTRRAFVSRADDTLIVEIASEDDLTCTDVRLELHKQEGTNKVKEPSVIKSEKSGEYEYIALKLETGEPFGAVARVVRVSPHKLLALVKLFPHGEYEDKFKKLSEELRLIEPDFDRLLERHAPLHKQLFGRCEFCLGETENTATVEEMLFEAAQTGACPDCLTELMWAYGRYLLISATRENGLPCALLGLWCGEYEAGWTFNMANINLEMIYWQTVGGNLPELMKPVFDYYDAQMPIMREAAKKVFGCRGIWLCAVTSPGSYGIPCALSHILNWTGGAAWISRVYYDYWLLTKDEEFLKLRLMPFLKETALFYGDFVLWQEGKWYVAPSVSPENQPEFYKGQRVEYAQGCANATMDFALIKEVFSTIKQLLPLTGGDGELEDMCDKMLAGAPKYTTNPDGSVREWNHPDFEDNNRHRHQSHIYPLFPGNECARSLDRSMFRQALDNRLKIGISHQTSWSLINMSMAYSRLNDGETALKCLSLISRAMLMGNLFTVHNDWRGMGIGLDMDWAPFQIDANIGWSAAVQEMLAYSVDGRLDICPALPNAWKSGRFTGLTTRTSISADIKWDEKRAYCSLTALRDTKLDLYAKTEFFVSLSLKKGEKYKLEFER